MIYYSISSNEQKLQINPILVPLLLSTINTHKFISKSIFSYIVNEIAADNDHLISKALTEYTKIIFLNNFKTYGFIKYCIKNPISDEMKQYAILAFSESLDTNEFIEYCKQNINAFQEYMISFFVKTFDTTKFIKYCVDNHNSYLIDRVFQHYNFQQLFEKYKDIIKQFDILSIITPLVFSDLVFSIDKNPVIKFYFESENTISNSLNEQNYYNSENFNNFLDRLLKIHQNNDFMNNDMYISYLSKTKDLYRPFIFPDFVSNDSVSHNISIQEIYNDYINKKYNMNDNEQEPITKFYKFLIEKYFNSCTQNEINKYK